jgi:hypothetical protein
MECIMCKPVTPEQYLKLIEDGMCVCGRNHETGAIVAVPPDGRGFERSRNEPPTSYDLYLGGMPGHVRQSYLERLCAIACPGVTFTCRYIKDKGSYSFAFITAQTMEAAVALYEALDGHRVSDKRFISVRNATPQR